MYVLFNKERMANAMLHTCAIDAQLHKKTDVTTLHKHCIGMYWMYSIDCDSFSCHNMKTLQDTTLKYTCTVHSMYCNSQRVGG